MVPPYIPNGNGPADTWLTNFSALITATPIVYGLTAPNAVTIAAEQVAYHDAYVLATDPPTRTSVTVAALVAQRLSMESIIRPFAQQVARNPAVLPGDKVALGLNLPNNVPVPIPPPTVGPTINLVRQDPLQVTLDIRNPDTPTSKAKPPGTLGIQVWTNVGVAAVTSPDDCTLNEVFTKNPNILGFSSGDRMKICTIFARFVNRSGSGGRASVGPWSLPLSVVIS